MMSIDMPSSEKIRERANERYDGCCKTSRDSFKKERLLDVCMEAGKDNDMMMLSLVMQDLINIIIDV